MSSSYLVALGSNRRHHRYGAPRSVVLAAMEELAALGTVTARSRVIDTSPLGAAQRRFANAALLLETELDPEALLTALQRTEREFGRRRWRRWGDRVLDLDIVLWSEGCFETDGLLIPHPAHAERDFVLSPAAQIAAGWRSPNSGLSVRQLLWRLRKRKGRRAS